MPSLSRLKIALTAMAYVPPAQLIGHARRRLRNRTVPRRAAAYRAALAQAAEALPPVAPSPTPAARAAAAVVAQFFGAKHAKNVPQWLAGRFTFLNRTHDFGSIAAIDWRVVMDEGNHQLWRSNLAFMGYVCAGMAAAPEAGLVAAAQLVQGFEAAARFEDRADFGELWHPYAVAQRSLALSAALIALPEALATRPERALIEAFLRRQIAYLLRNLETELGYNHLERNLSALALYGLATGTIPAPVSAALNANFEAVVRRSFGDDGVQKERCPMYQGLCVQSLRVFAAWPGWSEPQRALVTARLAAAEAAYAALTLGDGQPAMLNDGWFDEAPPAATLIPGPAPGFVALREAGYVRLALGEAVAIFDAGPIGVDSNPGHGHADFLSVELSLGAERLIVDPGTYRYSAGAERDLFRAWERHNGPMILGAAPVEYTDSFKVGRRAAARLERAEAQAEVQEASGSLRFARIAVSRRVRLTADGMTLTDRWRLGRGERMTRLLVPADWQIEERQPAGLVLVKGGRRVAVVLTGGALEVAPGQWSRRYNVLEEAHELRCRPSSTGMTIAFAWG